MTGTYVIVTGWQEAGGRLVLRAVAGMPPLHGFPFGGPGAYRPGAGDFLACADGGYRFARAAGVEPDAVIGDLDSLTAEDLQALADRCACAADDEPRRPQVIRHPKEKDDTDTMLCVKDGIARGYSNFCILGGLGGDFAHTVATLQALSFLTDMECAARVETGAETVFMLDGVTLRELEAGVETHETAIEGTAGQAFSVFSYAERTVHVAIDGDVKYPLADAVLTQSYPVGLHNEFAGSGPCRARIACGYGRLLVVYSHQR
ncbi:MAG: thiamine diphosphokinase [Clostridiales Family XIII bacterium]|jgi:thiamine pyrophosphokinase|nr:thiamine diphosphokinase [Clostridiales Family XIII bacterium]